jgi:hypothetical protein
MLRDERFKRTGDMKPTMAIRIVLNLCTLIASIILSFGLLEVALQVYNPIVQSVKGGEVVVRPNYDEVRRNNDIPGVAAESHIHQNSIGFRGADPPANFADYLTIITVGGSTTRSAEQSDERTWTALLGDAIANCFYRSWTNNAGFDGHSSFAHIQLIRNYIVGMHPKMVVMLTGANEIFPDVLERHDLELSKGQVVGQTGVVGFVKDLVHRSEVISLSLTFYRSFRAWSLGVSAATLWRNESLPADSAERLNQVRAAQSQYADRLRLIIRTLREADIIPVFVTQPTIAGVGKDPTTGKDLFHLWYNNIWYQSFDYYNETMRDVAQNEKVQLIDLARIMPRDSLYFWDPIHYTDAGSKEVFEIIARSLLPYLKREFPTFAKRGCKFAKNAIDLSDDVQIKGVPWSSRGHEAAGR